MDPIEQRHRDMMNTIMEALVNTFPGCGITLMVFDLGDDPGAKNRMNYISNADRSDMLTAMREFIAKHEGRLMDPPGRPQ